RCASTSSTSRRWPARAVSFLLSSSHRTVRCGREAHQWGLRPDARSPLRKQAPRSSRSLRARRRQHRVNRRSPKLKVGRGLPLVLAEAATEQPVALSSELAAMAGNVGAEPVAIVVSGASVVLATGEGEGCVGGALDVVAGAVGIGF